jgi:hypothetical protein
LKLAGGKALFPASLWQAPLSRKKIMKQIGSVSNITGAYPDTF